MQSVHHQHSPTSPRSWWSRSATNLRLPSDKQANGSSTKQSKKFNTLATAIGLKPRKHAITIQEPPSPVLPLHTGNLEPLPLSSNRHSDTGNSWDEPPEPKTPSDVPKHLSYTQSVMTTSEIDPFAAHFIPTSPVTLASNRISAFSDISTTESSHNADFTLSLNRQSYTSSSDNSHSYHSHQLPSAMRPPLPSSRFQRGLDVPVDVGTSPPLLSPIGAESSELWRASRLTTHSEKIMRREPPFMSLDSVSAGDSTSPQIRSSPSSSTLTDHNKSVRVDAHISRPKSRPRGMTDVGPSTRARNTSAMDPRSLLQPSFAPSLPPPLPEPHSSAVPRRPSPNRTMPFPATPVVRPAVELPPPPHPPPKSPHHLRGPSPPVSASSSDISFASTSSYRDSSALHHTTRQPRVARTPLSAHAVDISHSKDTKSRDAVASGSRVQPSPTAPQHRREFSPTRTLKKAISSQSLRRASNDSTVTATAPVPTGVDPNRAVKKQRSFHHSRIPLPPLPTSLRHTSSTGSVSHVATTQHDEQPPANRRISNGSQASSVVQYPPSGGRRRLFSGSSLRRSISSQAQSPAGEDDARSVFSFEDLQHHRPKSSQRPVTATTMATTDASHESNGSFWDDNDEPRASAITGAGEYAPQHIMSPADMLKLEASLHEDDSGARGAAAATATQADMDIVMMRARGMSLTSVATTFSGTFSEVGVSVEGGQPLLPPLTTSPLSPSARSVPSPSNAKPMSPLRSPDTTGARSLGVPSRSPQQRRPLTAEAVVPAPSGSSLPPPPRPRPRPRPSTSASPTSAGLDRRASTAPVTPLSPPPAWKGIGRTRVDSASSSTIGPGSSAPRPVITRRPSFLEIEERGSCGSIDDSFLDMGKSSFDTARSTDDYDDYGR
ncbi:hypothetical protein K488DRAFT_84265 [Vararia minispora EC-137]|uniref:Uncharacterized protein n=1 Tax=Vararia minispora EC-137 TaxID=1314806 RepID=A0ACB8QS31_9AGAM|nr:hypothetical protein K488DRAFT_84265 [Vararia minispora EC-137]